MNRPIVYGILSFCAALALVLYMLKRPPAEPTPTPGSSTPTAPEATKNGATQTTQRRINVKLFFAIPGSKYLASEERSVPYRETLLAQAREVLSELVTSPSEKLGSAIPKDTRFLDLFISKDGIAYADFSGELISNHPGGTDGEISTVYSIVNTLTLNFPQIKRVQILVDSKAVDTLKGHIDLSHPLVQDLSFVSKQPQEGAPGVEKTESKNTLGIAVPTFIKQKNSILA